MSLTFKAPASHFLKDGRIDRRAELKDMLGTVNVSGAESRLRWLTMDSPGSAVAYALFEDIDTGKRWAAVALTETTKGKSIRCVLMPEWDNPPYHECGNRILNMLAKSNCDDQPGAAAWRRICRENAASRGASTAFGNLPEGTRMIWTVGNESPLYLPRGRQIRLEKAKIQRRWCWKDMDSDAVYADKTIPESERSMA